MSKRPDLVIADEHLLPIVKTLGSIIGKRATGMKGEAAERAVRIARDLRAFRRDLGAKDHTSRGQGQTAGEKAAG